MKVLVTGSAGFIGTHLCRILREDDHDVVGIDLKTGHDVLECVLPDVDKVFHLAAQTDARSEDAAKDAHNNIIASVRVFQHYRSKVTFASSSAVNFPFSPYAISKLACEHYASVFGCGVARFCNIYGPGSKSFLDIYKDKDYVNANRPGTQVRTYAHVDAACEILLTCKPGELRILGGIDWTVQGIIDSVYSNKKVNWLPPAKYDVIEGRQIYAL